MKTFSLEMEICRQRRGHDVVWLAELDWDGAVGRYSSRPVTIGGLAYSPILADVHGLRLAMPSIVPESSEEVNAVRLELINTAEEGADRFEIRAENESLEGRTVRVGFVFLNSEIVLQSPIFA